MTPPTADVVAMNARRDGPGTGEGSAVPVCVPTVSEGSVVDMLTLSDAGKMEVSLVG
jgi:hypothetical protein